MTPQLPIFWSPRLNLDSLQDIERKLNAPLLAPDGIGIRLTNGEKTVEASSCLQYLKAERDGFYPLNNQESGYERSFINCYALQYLAQAQPAAKSYVDHNTWPDHSPSLLPPLLEVGERDVEEKAQAAREAGESWQSFDPHLTIKSLDGDTLTLQDDNWTYTMTILAAADFNRDGIEDLAISGSTNPKLGFYFGCRFLILTRDRQGANFRLLTDQRVPYRFTGGVGKNENSMR